METEVPTQNSRGSFYRNPEQEIAELKQKLREMSALCQQLQDKFEIMDTKLKASEMQKNSSRNEDSPSNYDCVDLKEQLKELAKMNVNWQQYNAKQEKTIQEQARRIARLEQELSTRSPGQLPESQQIEFDQLLLAKKHECTALEEEKEKVEDENHRLRLKLAEIQSCLDEQCERCGLLETQLLMYQEDFKTERSDRERAQSKVFELEEKLSNLSKSNQFVQGSIPVQATTGYSPYESFGYRLPHDMPLRGRGIYQTDCGGATSGATGEVSASLPILQARNTLDGHIGQPRNAIVPTMASVHQTDGFDETDGSPVLDLTEDLPNHHISFGDVLSCPKCRRSFTRDRHLDLVEHMEECD